MFCKRYSCALRNTKFCKIRCQFNDAKLQQEPHAKLVKLKRPRTHIQFIIAEIDAVVQFERKLAAKKEARKW